MLESLVGDRMRKSPNRGLRIVGVLIIAVAGALASATEWAARRDRADAVRLSQSTDSATLASARYHGAHAEQTLATRWDWTGHGSLGALGLLVGVALLSLGQRARAN